MKKKRGVRSAESFRKKLLIPDHEIYESIEHILKSKIEKIFVNKKRSGKYSVKVYKIDPYFGKNYKRKYKLIMMVKHI